MSEPTVSPSDAHLDDEAPDPTAPPDAAAGPPADEATGDAAGGPSAEADRLRAEAGQLQDKLLRQAAEYQNYRRRSENDRAEAVRRGRQEVLLPVLDVYDDLRRSLEAARQSGGAEGAVGALVEGVELVHRKFQDALGRVGVEPIEAVGRPFDEEEHEAVMQQPAEDAEPGTVLAEVQPGYRLGDRVLRHARVIVAA
jgi:molecular chaperone GrpE